MIGFTRENAGLAQDLRCLGSILGYRIQLGKGLSTCGGKGFNTFVGWIKTRVESYNQKDPNQVVRIVEGEKPAVVYDVQVDGDHVFCLANRARASPGQLNPPTP